MLAVETRDLTKDYLTGFWRKRPRRALDRLNLKVEASETFGLLGPNGAGKSTTLKLLFRLIFPTSGTARILGRDLSDLSVHARLGYLPENPSFYDHLSAPEFLAFAGELFGLDRSTVGRRSEELLERVGLAEARRLPVRKFSKGMVQRLGIAQALMNDPDLVFLDEPMSGLDPIGRREVRNLILDLRREGKTIFFSTHILSDAEALCDRVAILNRGQLLGSGDLRELLRLDVSATEVVLADPPLDALEKLRPLARSVARAGSQVRMEFGGEHDPEFVLKTAQQSGARIVSFNPVKSSLEDYFMAQVGAPSSEVNNARLSKTDESSLRGLCSPKGRYKNSRG
ncbi:MAG TPA: ABC transporter ATP-binding protein [Terriglobia bacterium]|nr:ABC transporter ATP-binding protein [Terriglobia bacterium]